MDFNKILTDLDSFGRIWTGCKTDLDRIWTDRPPRWLRAPPGGWTFCRLLYHNLLLYHMLLRVFNVVPGHVAHSARRHASALRVSSLALAAPCPRSLQSRPFALSNQCNWVSHRTGPVVRPDILGPSLASQRPTFASSLAQRELRTCS